MALVKLNNRAVKDIDTLGFGTGDLTFISKQTASSSASISFTSGIDSTYKEYVFYFVNMHPASDGVGLQFNMSVDSGSNYNVTKTSTQFYAEHDDGDSFASLSYWTGGDLAQSTSNQKLGLNIGADNNQSASGFLHLFNPSSSVFVKHFMATINTEADNDNTSVSYIAGYGNTTSPINAIKFQMSSGNIDSGEILLYGVN